MIEKETDAVPEPDSDPVQNFAALIRILQITRPEWCYLFIAAIAAIVIGASFPGFSILFGEFYGVSVELLLVSI